MMEISEETTSVYYNELNNWVRFTREKYRNNHFELSICVLSNNSFFY